MSASVKVFADALRGLDRVVHEPARLLLLSILAVVDEADFTFLLANTGMTAGNVGGHVRKLEEAKYVKVRKEFQGRRPRTLLSLTKRGQKALSSYREAMQAALGELDDPL